MSRTALIVWLVSPLLVIAALALMMDRARGKPDPRLLARQAARLPGQAADSPRDQASIDRDIAATEARRREQQGQPKEQPTAAASQPPTKAAAENPPRLVQPESLEQGFILVVEDKSQRASNDSPIFLASSHNGWNPGDPAMKLSRRSDMRWQIVLPKPALDSKMGFKFTRGSWDTVEVDAKLNDIKDRTLDPIDASKVAPGEKPVIELAVQAWHDQGPSDKDRAVMEAYRPIAVSAGTIRRVEVVGGGGVVKARDLIVWLPPGYDDKAGAEKTYPVLYLMDGQNLFDKHAGIPAEWGADETAAALIEQKKIEPIIIVGIPHAGAGRMAEYTVEPLMGGGPSHGREFIEFLVGEVKPRIDRLFRTAQGPENTAVGGASLGGLIALEAATEHSEVFGKVLAESTPLAMNNRAPFTRLAAKKNWPRMVYFGMGGKEAGTQPEDDSKNASYAASAQAFGELLKGKGFTGQTLRVSVDPDAVHNEGAWAKRLPGALEFLFPAK